MHHVLITYESKVLSTTDRVKFLYALKGRDGTSGVLSHYDAKNIGKNVVLAKATHKDELKAFFLTWNMPITIHTIEVFEKEDVKP